MSTKDGFIQKTLGRLGPGLLMAAAAIGVSHLVQSTRAGANFGWQLLVIVLLANLFKYPFFEYGHRYYASTGETLLSGYKRIGKKYLYIFLILNFFTSMASVAAVTFVTAAILQNLIADTLSLTAWSALILAACVLLLSLGHYKLLDRFIKYLMVLLLLATLAAVVGAFWRGPVAPVDFVSPSPWNWPSLPFLIALMGWMPAPIELSVWQSLWLDAADRTSGKRTTLREAKIDFNFGYLATVILAIAFLSLGALVMHGSARGFSSTPAGFIAQVISLYTEALGAWAKPLISIAAFTTMFSTTITLIDAYPRSLALGTRISFPSLPISHRPWLAMWFLFIGLAALLIIYGFSSRLKAMVDLVTIMAFLAGPVFAFINFRLITSKHVPKEDQPGPFLKSLSVLGLLFLSGFSIVFLYSRFFLISD